MKSFFDNAINSELFFVYGLIFVVVFLIVVILVIDRKENKKKNKSFFDTLNMKVVTDPINDNFNKIEKLQDKIEVIEVQQDVKGDSFDDLRPIDTVPVKEEVLLYENDDVYIETDLEKTQAQLAVEEITKALEGIKKEEDTEQYTKFEKEQEEDAIISYNELRQVFDKLYDENEKVQYIEDDDIPINIDELYNKKQKLEEQEVPQRVKLDDFDSMKKVDTQTTSTFKSSPLLSPVYGIQEGPINAPEKVENTYDDSDIKLANQFLNNLKELKNNLD